MKKISSKCWEYRGFTILKENRIDFPYRVYDDEGFPLDAFNALKHCRGFIDSIKEG